MPQRHECWEQEQPKDRLPFSAATLLLAAIDAVRHRLVYNTDDASDTIEALTEFVELKERTEGKGNRRTSDHLCLVLELDT